MSPQRVCPSPGWSPDPCFWASWPGMAKASLGGRCPALSRSARAEPARPRINAAESTRNKTRFYGHSSRRQVPGKGRTRKGHCKRLSAGLKLGGAGAVPAAFPAALGLGGGCALQWEGTRSGCPVPACTEPEEDSSGVPTNSCYTEGSQTQDVKPPPNLIPLSHYLSESNTCKKCNFSDRSTIILEIWD